MCWYLKIAQFCIGPVKSSLMAFAQWKAAVWKWQNKWPWSVRHSYHSNRRSLRKDRRSTHINNCRHIEIAYGLARQRAELKYCFTCFDWLIEEDWDEHCQFHFASVSFKICSIIVHCSTLVRPAFCPFCMGDNTLSASLRWSSWIRQEKLWRHLESHIKTSCWPLDCPHPWCNLELDDETSFLYHLNDAHDLRRNHNKMFRKTQDSRFLVDQALNATNGKRKRQDENAVEIKSLKVRSSTLAVEFNSFVALTIWLIHN